jgi:ribosomal-protein-alanine N-acetyltransferase
MNIRPAAIDEVLTLAEVHAAAFDAPWSAADLAPLMQGRGAFTLVAETDAGELAGFVLCRQIAGEAEVLTLAVRPAHRRQGVAQALMEVAIALAAASAQSMFLEVADDNAGAIALYEQAGFEPVGRRVRYYARPSGEGADAIVMRRTLNS